MHRRILRMIFFFFFFFFFFQTIHDAVFELAWSDEPEEDSKDNKRSELFASHTCIMLIFAILSANCRPF